MPGNQQSRLSYSRDRATMVVAGQHDFTKQLLSLPHRADNREVNSRTRWRFIFGLSVFAGPDRSLPVKFGIRQDPGLLGKALEITRECFPIAVRCVL